MEEQTTPKSEKEYISYEDFTKLEMTIGKILSAVPVEGTDKLLLCKVDIGEEEPRQIVSGIRLYFEDDSFETIVGKSVLYLTNIKPRTIRGFESHGMLMAIGDENSAFSFIVAEGDVKPGSQIR
jgi:methionyl-tRNA synthetase